MKKILIFTLFALFCGASLFAAQKNCSVKYSPQFPALDGRIDGDPAWTNVPWQGNFLVHRKNEAPKSGSRFKALYTKDALYIAVECMETDPAKLKKVYNFDEFWIYDTVELFLHVGQNEILQFIANYESMMQETIPGTVVEKRNFMTGWKAAGTKGKHSWTVEFCIPFYLIGQVPGAKAVRIPGNICRNSTTTKQRSTWNLQMGGFKEPKGFGVFVLESAPAAVRNDLQKALKIPHWISLVTRWESISRDPVWQAEILARFPAECKVLQELYANKADYVKNTEKFYLTLSRIEAYAKDQKSREEKRIRKRLFEE